MKKNSQRILLPAIAALGLLLTLRSPAAPVAVEALQRLGLEAPRDAVPAPDFRLPTLDGRAVSLAEHRGHVVLLNFWTTW